MKIKLEDNYILTYEKFEEMILNSFLYFEFLLGKLIHATNVINY